VDLARKKESRGEATPKLQKALVRERGFTTGKCKNGKSEEGGLTGGVKIGGEPDMTGRECPHSLARRRMWRKGQKKLKKTWYRSGEGAISRAVQHGAEV